MSRAIHLTRFHALNWYGYRDSIPVDGNLLLAGVTGSGKSILMDLIQFVLVGDLRLVKFNQSATGTHSDRSLKGYVLGDTKQEEGGVTQYMRDSAVSYVALEFTWPNRRKAETWGFRIEFASAAESQGRVTPFFIPAALSRGDFLDEEKRPLDYTAFKALAESRTDRDGVRGRLYSTIDEYTRDLQQPTHLNFNYKILRGLLPTAMSFTFLRSFNDFCRQFILSADRLDVRDVTDSYRAFQRYEKDLKELNDQFERLRGIATLFTTHENFRRDAALERYLEAELRHAHAADLLREDEEKLVVLRSACAEEESRLKARMILVSRYFAPEERIAFFETLGLQTGGRDETTTARVLEEAEEVAKRKGRCARFAVRVVSEYRFTCALTGYCCLTSDSATIVDAAHIEKWASTQNDNPENGLALSKNAHWMFDEGLWSVDEDFRVVVASNRFTENGPEALKLVSFAGRHLQFDPSAKLRPAPELLKRHRHYHGIRSR